MSMRILDNFEPHINAPLDTRAIVVTKAELNTMLSSTDQIYAFMKVFCVEDKIEYQLSEDKTKWNPISFNVKSKLFTKTTDVNGCISLDVKNVIAADYVKSRVDQYSLDDNYELTSTPVDMSFYATPFIMGTTWYLYYSSRDNILANTDISVNVYYIE